MHIVCCCLFDFADFRCFDVLLVVWFGIVMHVLIYFCVLCLVCLFRVLVASPERFLAPPRHACISCLDVCAELCLCHPLPPFFRCVLCLIDTIFKAFIALPLMPV